MCKTEIAFQPTRRQILAAVVSAGLIASSRPVIASQTDGYKTKTFRARAIIKLNGEVHLKSQISEAVDAKGRTTIARKAPFQSTVTLDFEENSQFDNGFIDCTSLLNVVEASSDIQVDRHLTKTTLREECQEVVRFSRTSKRLLTTGLNAPMFTAEVNLIELPINCTFLDEIVTKKQVKVTEKWSLSDALTSRLLSLDAIRDGELVACLVDADSDVAQIELTGKINGVVAGIRTTIEVDGKAQLDRKAGEIIWFAANVEEEREISERAPGYKVLAQVQIRKKQIDALTSGESLETVSNRLPSIDSASIRQFQSDLGHFRFIADSKWVTFRDNGEEAIYRFIVDNARIAQCIVTNMVDFEPGRQLSMDGFVADVKTSLSGSSAIVRESSEKVTSAKMRAVRVESHGRVKDVDVIWIHYHISNDEGRRAVLAFMLNADDAEVFGAEDSQIVNAFELINWPKKLDSQAVEQELAKSEKEKATETKADATTSSVPKISR
ncbi:MAG: hypothetical protein MUC43_04255 [Pirellula sp.]|nr:hypothetical protein [Pirellula sp.]